MHDALRLLSSILQAVARTLRGPRSLAIGLIGALALAGVTAGAGTWVATSAEDHTAEMRGKVRLEVHKRTRQLEARTYTLVPKNPEEEQAFREERRRLLPNPTAQVQQSGRLRSVAMRGWNTLNAAVHTPAPRAHGELEARAKALYAAYPSMPGGHPHPSTFAWGSPDQVTRLEAIVDAGLVPHVAGYYGPPVDDVRPFALVGLIAAGISFVLLALVAPFRMGFAAEVATGGTRERVQAAAAAAVIPLLWAAPQLAVATMAALWTGHAAVGVAYAFLAPAVTGVLCATATALVVRRHRSNVAAD